jgi:hypothetical protein
MQNVSELDAVRPFSELESIEMRCERASVICTNKMGLPQLDQLLETHGENGK